MYVFRFTVFIIDLVIVCFLTIYFRKLVCIVLNAYVIILYALFRRLFFFVHLMKHYYNCYFPLTPRGSLYTTQYHIFATKKSLMGLLFIIYEKRLSFVLWSVQKMESGNIKNVNDRQFEWHSKSICLKELLPLWYQI